ncbi:MAG: ParB/RepB/Spo0J family partition protein [Candidatus Avoscillospira sp.]
MAEEKARDPTPQEAKPVSIPLAKIHDLPGSIFAPPSEKSLEALTSSIVLKGVQEPVVLRQREDGEFQIVSGNRRRKASELAKKTEIPAFVYDMTEKEARDFRLKDNAQGKPPGKLLTEAEIGKKQEIKAPPEPTKKTVDKPIEPKTAEPEPAVIGPAALGPTGTQITKIFDGRLTPPDDKALKDLPAPKDGESYFITLHPAYLEKSKFNTVSVDVNSDDYRELKKSIELNGVKDPVLTRINPEGGLEILSGQRRHMIARELNYPVPAIIQKIDDNDAMILVADSNLHRPHISTYDLSRTLRNKMTAMKRKAGRKKRGTPSAEELNSDAVLAREMGISISKLNRILRLSEATKDVCEAVDDNSIELSIASEISFLKPKNQDEVIRLSCLGYKPNVKRVQRLRAAERAGQLNEAQMRSILEDKDLQPVKPPVPIPASEPPKPTSPPMTAPVSAPPTPAPSQTQTAQTQAEPAQETPPKADPVPVQTGTTVPPPKDTAPKDAPPAPEEEPIAHNSMRDNLYSTKVTLGGDRLRKYFPDTTMTPAAIVESIYSALEERRQREERMKQKTGLLHAEKNGPVR